MRNLDGLEMICFGRSKYFELVYEGGTYMNRRREPIEDVLDMACYMCSAAYYTRSGDAIEYCPNCGHVDRKRFTRREDLLEFLLGNDLSWTTKNGLQAISVETFEGEWRLVFTRDPRQLDAGGRYKSVRAL